MTIRRKLNIIEPHAHGMAFVVVIQLLCVAFHVNPLILIVSQVISLVWLMFSSRRKKDFLWRISVFILVTQAILYALHYWAVDFFWFKYLVLLINLTYFGFAVGFSLDFYKKMSQQSRLRRYFKFILDFFIIVVGYIVFIAKSDGNFWDLNISHLYIYLSMTIIYSSVGIWLFAIHVLNNRKDRYFLRLVVLSLGLSGLGVYYLYLGAFVQGALPNWGNMEVIYFFSLATFFYLNKIQNQVNEASYPLLMEPYSPYLISVVIIVILGVTPQFDLGETKYGVFITILVAFVIRQVITLNENQELQVFLEGAVKSAEEREAYYQAISERSSDLLIILNRELQFKYASQAFYTYLGYYPTLGFPVYSYLHPEDTDKWVNLETAERLTLRLPDKEGKWNSFEASIQNFTENPQINGWVLNLRNVDDVDKAISKIQNLNRELQSRLEQLNALHNIDSAITKNMPLESTLRLILSYICEDIKVFSCAVRLMRENDLEVVSIFGFRNDSQMQEMLKDSYESSINAIKSKSAQCFYGQSVGCYILPLLGQNKVWGVLELYHADIQELIHHQFLKTLVGQACIAIEYHQLLSDLRASNYEMNQAYFATIEGWARALDLRDKETEGHARRVTDLTLKMAHLFEIPEHQIEHIRRGALLHDIGKMGIPDSILLKPGKLNEEEWEIMKKHPEYAYNLLKPIQFLAPALDIPYAHHEKWDGTGYPRGLKGEEIPLAARLFAIVDVWDALTNDRPYHKAWKKEDVKALIKEQAGKHFDPKVVEAFFSLNI